MWDYDGLNLVEGKDGLVDAKFSSDDVFASVIVMMMPISAVMVFICQQSETPRPRACHSLCTAFSLHTSHRMMALHTEVNTAHCTEHTEIYFTGMHFTVHTACHSLFTFHCFCTVQFTALILSVQLQCTGYFAELEGTGLLLLIGKHSALVTDKTWWHCRGSEMVDLVLIRF